MRLLLDTDRYLGAFGIGRRLGPESKTPVGIAVFFVVVVIVFFVVGTTERRM